MGRYPPWLAPPGSGWRGGLLCRALGGAKGGGGCIARTRRSRRAAPGWDHNPSSWSHRRWVVGLALAGAGIASYLTLYQAGLMRQVWEPFFGDGSATVLHSWVSSTLTRSRRDAGRAGVSGRGRVGHARRHRCVGERRRGPYSHWESRSAPLA